MIVIGLTGGIGTGKSTVSNYLKSLGYAVCDTDLLARNVVEKGSVGLTKLVEQFGECILLDDKTLDRHKLANIIFNNPDERNRLNNILHPLIFEEITKWKTQQHASVVFIDMPLLFEVDYNNQVDMTMVVYATKEQQITRLQKRNNYTVEEATTRINAQMPIEEKRKMATVIIDNSKDELYTQKQIRDFLNTLNML